MPGLDTFDDDLAALGFRRTPSRKAAEWAMQATRYLTFSVLLEPDESILVSWELAIGELLRDRDLQVGSNDPLNLFLFPQGDVRGTADAAFVQAEIARVRTHLESFDLTGR